MTNSISNISFTRSINLLGLLLSIGFAVYGLLPYKKAHSIDTTKPNQLIISQQVCGCPCPNAIIDKGELEIPYYISSKFKQLPKTQINLEIKDFYEPYNYELAQARLFIRGKVVGVDTIFCNPASCELAPRFLVEDWTLVDSVSRAWVFPQWAVILFLLNLFLFMPTLIMIVLIEWIRHLRYKTK